MKLKLLFALTFFFKVVLAQKESLIITEVLADPIPSLGLPAREFIEVFNKSNDPISAKGLKLYYGSFKTNFPDSVLLPKTYYILCRKDFVSEFEQYGRVIPLANFSLPNNGALLVIKNANDEIMNFVNYDTDWFDKPSDGGTSLEMINLENHCLGKSNWKISQSNWGGTPGIVNSVNSYIRDELLPSFVNYDLEDEKLTVIFNKNLDKDFLSSSINFEIIAGDNEIVKIDFDPYKTNKCVITLKRKIEGGESAVLFINKPRDCLGNVGEEVSIDLSNLPLAEKGDVVLSEVLFNPRAGGEDFIELYNNTEKIISLKKWKIANTDEFGKIKDIIELVPLDLKIKPNQYVAFSKNILFLKQNYPTQGNLYETNQMPAFNNDKGTVVLLNSNTIEFDRFQYTEKMHHSLLLNPEGVSLERASFEHSNSLWFSASSDVGYATPGSKNSQTTNDDLRDVFFAEPEVFNPFLSGDLAITRLKYNLTAPGVSVNIVILDKNGKTVKTLANNMLLGTSGEIEWDGKGSGGEILPVGYYVFRISTYSTNTNKIFLAKCVLGSY